MTEDTFGDLQDWGRVLHQIEQLRQARSLDEHQPGLTRILRYRDNWQLREAVLKVLPELDCPSYDVISEAERIMMDENTYLEARILAVDALSHLVRKYSGRLDSDGSTVSARVSRRMEMILKTPQAPILHEAIQRSLSAIQAPHPPEGEGQRAVPDRAN